MRLNSLDPPSNTNSVIRMMVVFNERVVDATKSACDGNASRVRDQPRLSRVRPLSNSNGHIFGAYPLLFQQARISGPDGYRAMFWTVYSIFLYRVSRRRSGVYQTAWLVLNHELYGA